MKITTMVTRITAIVVTWMVNSGTVFEGITEGRDASETVFVKVFPARNT